MTDDDDYNDKLSKALTIEDLMKIRDEIMQKTRDELLKEIRQKFEAELDSPPKPQQSLSDMLRAMVRNPQTQYPYAEDVVSPHCNHEVFGVDHHACQTTFKPNEILTVRCRCLLCGDDLGMLQLIVPRHGLMEEPGNPITSVDIGIGAKDGSEHFRAMTRHTIRAFKYYGMKPPNYG